MRRIVQRRTLNERVDDDVPNLEEMFREQDVPEPDGIPKEAPPDGNKPESPVAADEAPAEPPVHESEQLVQDQLTGVPQPREVTVVSPDTGPARRPRREIRQVIRLGIDK